MQLFYEAELNENSQQVIFDKKESGHIIKVLRKQQGDLLHITNGKGHLFTAEIVDANHNKCIAAITDFIFKKAPSYKLHLAVAPTKRNERYEWFLEKATEIGIGEITPVICERSERKSIKTIRYERVLQSAMKQSLQSYLPKLNHPKSLMDFLKTEQSEQRFIAHCIEDEKKLLKNSIHPNTDISILIGPEGDFSENEIETALSLGWKPISLGDSRLRTETAAIVACHTVSICNQ